MRKRMKLLLAFAVAPILLSGCIISPWYYDDGPGYHHHDHGGYYDRGYYDRGHDGRWYDGRGYGRR